MPEQQASVLPQDLALARQRINTWRAESTQRRTIPDDFWSDAVKLATVHGINRVAEAMGFSHHRLKSHMSTQPRAKPVTKSVNFVQLTPTDFPHVPSKVSLNITDGNGRSMTLQGIDCQDSNPIIAAFYRLLTEHR